MTLSESLDTPERKTVVFLSNAYTEQQIPNIPIRGIVRLITPKIVKEVGKWKKHT